MTRKLPCCLLDPLVPFVTVLSAETFWFVTNIHLFPTAVAIQDRLLLHQNKEQQRFTALLDSQKHLTSNLRTLISGKPPLRLQHPSR